ncbi:MAG: hypothetical protein ACYDCB_03805 [Candidatus Dormibacteria bacterium]
MVPCTAVRCVRVVRGASLGRSGFKVDLERQATTLTLGDTTVVVDVDSAGRLLVHGNRLTGPVATLAISADTPRDFAQALSRLCSTDTDGPLAPGAAELPHG